MCPRRARLCPRLVGPQAAEQFVSSAEHVHVSAHWNAWSSCFPGITEDYTGFTLWHCYGGCGFSENLADNSWILAAWTHIVFVKFDLILRGRLVPVSAVGTSHERPFIGTSTTLVLSFSSFSIYQKLPRWKHTFGIKGGAGEDADWPENRKFLLGFEA